MELTLALAAPGPEFTLLRGDVGPLGSWPVRLGRGIRHPRLVLRLAPGLGGKFEQSGGWGLLFGLLSPTPTARRSPLSIFR